MRYAAFTFGYHEAGGGMRDCSAMFLAADDAAAKAHVESLMPGVYLEVDGATLELYELVDTGHRFVGGITIEAAWNGPRDAYNHPLWDQGEFVYSASGWIDEREGV